ncbi:vascular endothelial growth factor C-like [Clytia hemisphaerica]|uniref:Uncharacterized protein n=1 Tax=Clytia hemisphaerica TaxID=252671 RepID=A0A7M5XET5_9CNID
MFVNIIKILLLCDICTLIYAAWRFDVHVDRLENDERADFDPKPSSLVQNRGVRTVSHLPNIYCAPRKTVVRVDVPLQHYSPMMVEVNRCAGVADNVNPQLKDCVKSSSEKIRFPVRSKLNPTYSSYKEVENHLSCKGRCKYDATQCKGASKWDEKQCKCICPSNQYCPPHYSWNPIKCACTCSRRCHKRQILDLEDCTCMCKAKFFKRCSKRGHGEPSPIDCQCMGKPLSRASCQPCRCRKSVPESFLLQYLFTKKKQ